LRHAIDGLVAEAWRHQGRFVELDPGRLCVLLTRHRQAWVVVVGRSGDACLLDGHPSATPAYLGWDPDPTLDGWEVHRAAFDELAPFRVAA
jgi:hypothetical protein